MEHNEYVDLAINVQHSKVANKLRSLRQLHKYSIAAVALKSGVKAEIIFDYENDRRKIKKRDIEKLAMTYGVTAEEILLD